MSDSVGVAAADGLISSAGVAAVAAAGMGVWGWSCGGGQPQGTCLGAAMPVTLAELLLLLLLLLLCTGKLS